MNGMSFIRKAHDAKTSARTGELQTAHGAIETPVFMPVGTLATVKTLSPDDLMTLGTEIILSNTYHLNLRPGCDIIQKAGGLHEFMAWPKPILTDSGGFQVFSLARLRSITDLGVTFQSHIDGSKHELTPAKVIDLQLQLGSDILMPLDECVSHDASQEEVRISLQRTHRWASLSKERFLMQRQNQSQMLFGIVQGGMFTDLRVESAEELLSLDFPGYAIGGLSVGEERDELYRVLDSFIDLLPEDRPRYLMGVGEPVDLVRAIGEGIDMFDCVMPTRNARNGSLFTKQGPINIRNARFIEDFTPIEEECACATCQKFTKAYLRHLMQAQEILGLHLNSIHNLHFVLNLVRECREHIEEGTFENYKKEFCKEYQSNKSEKVCRSR